MIEKQNYRHIVTKNSPIAGRGVYTTKPIAAWEKVLPVDDTRLVTPENPLRPELGEFDYHCDDLANGVVIYLQEPERYINHCCDPNAFCRIYDGVRYVVARRDIASGEEITTDYCVNSVVDHSWDCSCGAKRCRKTGTMDFFTLPISFQIEYLPLLDEWFIRENRERLDPVYRAARLSA